MRWGMFSIVAPLALVCALPGQRADLTPASIGGGAPGPVSLRAASATPKAYGDCGRDAIPETGLQGQVPRADQDSGASRQGARCNLRLIGENDIGGRGANFQMGWYRHCAYVGSVGSRDYMSGYGASADELDGVAVLDVSDPAHPVLSDIVRAPDGVAQHEAVEVNEARGMLVVQTGGLNARYIDIYDVSQDCRRPVFKGRYDGGAYMFHGQRIAPDGRTIYATDYTGYAAAAGGVMHIIDVTDMSEPRLLMRWDPTHETPADNYGIHDLDVSADGNRLYLGTMPPSALRGVAVAGGPSNTGPTMVVLDVSDIQARRPDPDPNVVGDVRLENAGHTEQRATIGGRPYVFTSGETPFIGEDNCPWAWGNVVDVSDESRPKVVSEIRLEVNDPANCQRVGADDAVYSIHYVGVDDPDDTSIVFYTYYTGGVRAFDVRDPAHPKEIAYYHPSPVPDTRHEPIPKSAGDYQGPEWDSATSDIRYLPGARQLWVVSIGRGFQVLELAGPAATVARLRASLRVLRARRGRVRVRVRCSGPCVVRLRAGRGPRRTVRLRAAGTRRVTLRGRGRVSGTLIDPATGREVRRLRARRR